MLAGIVLTGCTPSDDDAPTTTTTTTRPVCRIDDATDYEWTSGPTTANGATLNVEVNYDASDVSKRKVTIGLTPVSGTTATKTFSLGDSWYVAGFGTLQMTGLRGPNDGKEAQGLFRLWPDVEC
jgi:hypothetical protein